MTLGDGIQSICPCLWQDLKANAHLTTWRWAVIFSIHNHFEVSALLGTSVPSLNMKWFKVYHI